MSVNSKMAAIADKIRALLGISGTMSLDAMATNLTTEQTNVTNAFTAVGSKGGTVPSSKVSGNLASAINTIPAGVEVKRKAGTITIGSDGIASVDCGFKPDLVMISGDLYEPMDGYYYDCHAAAVFPERQFGDVPIIGSGYFGTYKNPILIELKQTNSGFSADFYGYESLAEADIQFTYVAIKYTA